MLSQSPSKSQLLDIKNLELHVDNGSNKKSVDDSSDKSNVEGKDCNEIELDLTNDSMKLQKMHRDMAALKKQRENIISSNMPIDFKIKLIESLNDQIQMKLFFAKDINKKFKEEIINIQKIQNYTSQLEYIKAYKDSKRPKSFSTVTTSSTRITNTPGKKFVDDSTKTGSNSFASGPSFSESSIEDPRVESLRLEYARKEEEFTRLKEQRNNLKSSMQANIEDLSELSRVISSKTNLIEQLNAQVKEIERKITQRSSSKPGSRKPSREGSYTERSNRVSDFDDGSKLNTTTFKEVTSKFGDQLNGLISGLFSKKKPKTHYPGILPTDLNQYK